MSRKLVVSGDRLVAGYCRVSTDEQAREGISLDTQAASIRAFAKSQGWGSVEVYFDEFTGTTMDRPGFNRLLADIESGRVNTVLVYKLDRLARRQRLILSTLEEVFDKQGVTFKSVTEPFETGSAMGKAFIGMLAVFAQLERDTIAERTRHALAHKKREGQHCGRVPLGKVIDAEGKLVRDRSKDPLLNQIRRLAKSGVSVREIARRVEVSKSTVASMVSLKGWHPVPRV